MKLLTNKSYNHLGDTGDESRTSSHNQRKLKVKVGGI